MWTLTISSPLRKDEIRRYDKAPVMDEWRQRLADKAWYSQNRYGGADWLGMGLSMNADLKPNGMWTMVVTLGQVEILKLECQRA